MKIFRFLNGLITTLMVSAAFLNLALAQTTGGIPEVRPISGGSVNILTIANTIINWAFGLLLLLAAIFIIYAAFLYLTSGGGDGKDAAKNYIVYAVVAIVVGALAKGLVFIVARILNVQGVEGVIQ